MARKHHSTIIATERDKDRIRQQTRRNYMAENGIPETHAVDKAIVEAVGFVMASTTTTDVAASQAGINVGRLLRVAAEILADREGYDKSASKVAIRSRLEPRDFHRWTTSIPSFNPGPEEMRHRRPKRKRTKNDAAKSDDI